MAIDSRKARDTVRRRECQKCAFRWTTYERREPPRFEEMLDNIDRLLMDKTRRLAALQSKFEGRGLDRRLEGIQLALDGAERALVELRERLGVD